MSQCSYTYTQGQQRCPHPIWSGSAQKLCLFHDAAPDKPQAEIESLLQLKLGQKDFNFEGYIFHFPVNLRDKVFEEFANFENCQFLGREVSFYKAQFKKGALFNQAVFKGIKTNFSKARFEGDFNLFNGTHFEALETSFVETCFYGKQISFASAEFSGNTANFSQASFEGSVYFDKSQLKAEQNLFEQLQFSGALLSFAQCHFLGKELRFSEMQASGGEINFSNSLFESDQTLFQASLMHADKISFMNSFFRCRSVSFINAHFNFESLSFKQATFNCHSADFSGMHFERGIAEIIEANFQVKSLKFYPLTLDNPTTHFNCSEFAGEEKIFSITNPNQNDLSFQGVFFHGGKTRIKGDLQAASFFETSLDNVDFNEAQWSMSEGRLICRDEIDANRANSKAHYQKAVEVCRNIKQCYENFGSYETAGDFYYGEMECRRKLSRRPAWGGLQFMRFSCGYGERPVRVIFVSMGFILFCTFFYLFGGIETPLGIINFDLLEIKNLSSIITGFFNCLYFSVVSFTTLGYGDYHPVGWSRLIGASEGFFGAFFISLFVLTVGRKMNR